MATGNRLIDALSEQTTILHELQQTLQDEQRAIAEINTPLMESLNGQKEQLILQQRQAAEKLRQAITEAANQYGLPQSVGLPEVMEKMPPAIRSQVEPLQQNAKKLGTAVSVLANQNRGMLERFLGVVNDSLSFILRILSTSTTYGMRGTYLANNQSGAVMVNREV